MNKLLLLTIGVLSCSALARADAPIVAPLTIPEVVADDSAIWAGITSGQMSAAQAWKDGLLDAATVQTGLAKGVASGQSEDAMQLRRELGELLVKNAPAVVAAGATLPMGVQLALADYYASIGDERAALLYEAVIAQTKAPYEKALHLLALGKFWSKVGQPQKSEEVFGRGRATLLAEGKNPHLAAEMLLETARAWNKAGDSENARKFYDQTIEDGDGWMSSLSLYDRAMPLMDQGHLEEAAALLARPVKFVSHQSEGIIALNAWQASVAYRQGHLEEALSFGRKVEEAGQSGQFASASIKNLYHMGLDIYTRAGGWKNQPIQANTKEIVFQANPSQPDSPLYARFRIKTYGDKSVTASVDNPNIHARVLPVNNWQSEGLNAHEEEMEVIVQSNSRNKFNDVPLVLSSATRGKTTTVRLSLMEKSARSALPTGD